MNAKHIDRPLAEPMYWEARKLSSAPTCSSAHAISLGPGTEDESQEWFSLFLDPASVVQYLTHMT